MDVRVNTAEPDDPSTSDKNLMNFCESLSFAGALPLL